MPIPSDRMRTILYYPLLIWMILHLDYFIAQSFYIKSVIDMYNRIVQVCPKRILFIKYFYLLSSLDFSLIINTFRATWVTLKKLFF